MPDAAPGPQSQYVPCPLMTGGNATASPKTSIAAARAATSRMIDLLVDRWGFTDLHAYLLCSGAMNLRLSQVVNEPMFTVSAAIAKKVLPARRLF